jgi:hypothetical protein
MSVGYIWDNKPILKKKKKKKNYIQEIGMHNIFHSPIASQLDSVYNEIMEEIGKHGLCLQLASE